MHIFIFLFSFLFTQNLWAFKLNLDQSTINLAEGVYSATATIVNDGDGMIAIEASPRIRSYSKDGIENFEKEAENLVIVPSQMIIPSQGEQILNIRWIGPRDIAVERAYRLIIEYVSVSEDKLKGITTEQKRAGININYRIAKSFYVSPLNAKADIVVQKAEKTIVQGKDMLQLSCANIGNRHHIAHGLEVQITTASNEEKTVSFTKAELGGSINFLSQEVREIVIPWPESIQKNKILEAQLIGFGE